MPQHLRRLCQLLLAVAVVSILPGCGKSSPNSSRKGSELGIPAVQLSADALTERKPPSVKYTAQDQTETPAWLTEARDDLDANVRLQAIEAWARDPGETLDPVTYALVDPDESVRARAQELLEDALARR